MTLIRESARCVAAAIAGALLLAACGEGMPNEPRADRKKRAAVTSPVTSPDGHDGPDDLQPPPPVTVRFFDQSMDLRAWTYCYGNGCVDGAPPRNPPDVGNPDEVVVEFPLSGWSFKASFTPAGEECGRVQQVRLEPKGDGEFVLRPAGYAATYDVTLFGRGDGDLFTTFRWTTPSDGPLPRPTARLAVLADHDGRVDSYGVELAVTNLARDPNKALARITVRANGGDAITFKANPARSRCLAEGSLYWDGPDDKGLAAAELGDRPFTYKVELVLDGTRYIARATWPDDEIRGNEPSVALDFTPDLPSLP